MLLQSALFCLALNIHFEARGEPIQGQIAVAHVTMNRVKENKSNICHEVFKKGQFSWTQKRFSIPKGPEWEKAKNIAKLSLQSPDSVRGATYFFNPKKCHPSSIVKNKKKITKIGNHVFYANK